MNQVRVLQVICGALLLAASPQSDQRDQTASLMSGLLHGVNMPSPQVQSLMNHLRDRSLVGNSGGWAAGQAVVGIIGMGRCTRHFYNKSDSYWSVGLINSGWCHVDGDSSKQNGNVCMIPPHRAAVLDYSNSNANYSVIKVLIAGSWPGGHFAQDFNLKPESCKIAHNGSTGNVVLNDPADGDVVTCGRDSYPCR